MKKINLYLIMAPFQLLSAIESIERDEDTDVWLIIRGTKTSNNIDQILRVLDKSDWDKIIYLNGKSNALALFGLVWLKLFFIFKNIKVISLNIGEFRSRLCKWAVRVINSENVGFLDDGVATLAFYIPHKNSIKGISERDYLKDISPLYYNLSRQNKLIIKSFLTLPDSDYWKIRKYQFQKFRKKIMPSSLNALEGEVFFLGGKYVEDGYCNIETYLGLCKLVLEKFPNKKITYIPHRGESEEKILTLQKHFSFKTVISKIPVELYLAEMKSRPSAVISFQSAVLFTIPELFPEVRVYYARFDPTKFSEKFNMRGALGKYLEGMNNISIVDLE
jgi:hypothetical protein